jgi:hypothetical protein
VYNLVHLETIESQKKKELGAAHQINRVKRSSLCGCPFQGIPHLASAEAVRQFPMDLEETHELGRHEGQITCDKYIKTLDTWI